MSDNGNDGNGLLIVIALIFIGAGAYGLSIGDLGWAGIIIGSAMLAYIAMGKNK